MGALPGGRASRAFQPALGYAVSADGIGTIRVTSGAKLTDLFPGVEVERPVPVDVAIEEAQEAAEYAGSYQQSCEDGSLLQWEMENEHLYF